MVTVHGSNRPMRRAFTLIELLVTIAVIALLITIMLPALNKARGSARRTVCANQLRQVGVGLRLYLNESNDRLPYVSYMPSIGPLPLRGTRVIPIATVLKNFVTDPGAFRCPDDIADDARAAPNAGQTYFESEQSSYEFRVQLNGMTLDQVAARFKERFDENVAENLIWLMRDYNNFHGPSGKPGSRRYLYEDGHVTDFEN